MRSNRLAVGLVAIIILGTSAGVTAAADEPTWTESQRKHWSFVPPSRPGLPEVKAAGWVRNPIDAFVLAALEESELAPAPEADRVTLARRLWFDLTGLPPTPEQVDAFVADPRPDAYERLVDRLLASPAYGERWARPWLDLARYADSDGFKSDKTRPDAWRYRDWVVKALNEDMPYDKFVRLQLAGDELEPLDHDAFIATAFNRHWPFEDNNMVPGLNRQLMLDDMTDTTASVFLGLTVSCARCHDHKYDPISQRDYYRLQALFAASKPKDDLPLVPPFEAAVNEFVVGQHRARLDEAKRRIDAVERPYLATLLKDKLAKLPPDVREAFETDPEKRSAFQEDLLKKHAKSMTVEPKVMRSALSPEDRKVWESRGKEMEAVAKQAPRGLPVATGMTDTGTTAPPVFLLVKGNFYKPSDEVVPPGFLSVLGSTDLGHRPSSIGHSSTTGRRAALADWLTRPGHPLTARVMVNRLWQGHFGRGIVATASDFGTQGSGPSHPELFDWLATEFVARGWSMKAMHRLLVTSATYRQSSAASSKSLADDPDNLLFGRMNRRRLEGEAVRDALLSVSGRLNPRRGGPGVFPDLPPGVETRGGWDRSPKAEDRDRRSLYVFARRNLKYPLFDAFDAPDTNVSCPERNVSVNAPQALMLLNSDLVLDWSRAFADRVRGTAEGGGPSDLVTRAYRLALGRYPSVREVERSVAFLEAEPGSLVDFCHAVLNLNEFVFVD